MTKTQECKINSLTIGVVTTLSNKAKQNLKYKVQQDGNEYI